jgi:hypothetical protein
VQFSALPDEKPAFPKYIIIYKGIKHSHNKSTEIFKYSIKLKMVDRRIKLLPEELLVYVEEINKDNPDKYFPTNHLKLKLKKERGVYHCWATYQRKLKKLESEGKVTSVNTTIGPMWKLVK